MIPLSIAPGCCHGGSDDGDHPVGDGVLFFGLILVLVLAGVGWRLLTRRFTRSRIDERDRRAEAGTKGDPSL